MWFSVVCTLIDNALRIHAFLKVTDEKSNNASQ